MASNSTLAGWGVGWVSGQNHFRLMADKKANENNLRAPLSRPGKMCPEKAGKQIKGFFLEKRTRVISRGGSEHKTGCWGIKKE